MKYVFRSKKGLNQKLVRDLSQRKNEPTWMLEFRLKALEIFLQKPMPNWGADLSGLNHDEIYYYIKPIEQNQNSWEQVPDQIKETFEKLGIPKAERELLAGVGAQFE